LETKRNAYRFLVGSEREECHYEDLDMDGGRINLIVERERKHVVA
jgi:hypothetical protein